MKKWSIFLFIFSLTLFLSACGSGGASKPSDVFTPPSTSTSDTTTSSPGTTIGPPANISLSSTLEAGSSLSQEGQTTLTAAVTDENGNGVTDGTVVNFSANGGTITTSSTTTGGQASATYQAGTSGGIVTFTASTENGVSADLSIQVATGEAESIIKDNVSPETISVIGSGNSEISHHQIPGP